MPKNIVVIGPPGTGKTKSVITVASGWFKGGVRPDEVAYLAFTRAAANEAASRILDERLDLDFEPGEKKFPFFRTLHSLAYRGLLKERKDLRPVTPADMKDFSAWSGYEGMYAVTNVDDLADVYQNLAHGGRTDYDKLLSAYTLSRISGSRPDHLELAKTRMSKLAYRMVGFIENGDEAYKAFVKKYETYKKTNGLVDFTDMLAYALCEMPPIENVRHVVVDESQDLANALYSIVDRLFQSAETVWWAGDANQAIFGFAAADAKLFIERARKADHRIVLRQTHRFGQEIVDFSTKIILRARDRIVVDVIGKAGKSHEIRKTGEFDHSVEPMLVLHRHVLGCQSLGARYIAEGKPFRNERGRDPLGYDTRIQGFQTLHELAAGGRSTAGAAGRLVDDFMRSVLPPDASTGGKAVRLVVHGAKKRLQEGAVKGEVGLNDLVAAKILTSDGADALRARNLQAIKNEFVWDFEYYRKVVDNGYSLETVDSNGEPRVPVISTIHGSKGRQAPKVVVFDEYGGKCKEDMDNEHRLAYVAATRTWGGLEICAERRVDWAEERYDYPVDEMKPPEIDFDEP